MPTWRPGAAWRPGGSWRQRCAQPVAAQDDRQHAEPASASAVMAIRAAVSTAAMIALAALTTTARPATAAARP
ncbi:MAG TPA: hypothetical protein VMV07_13290, partial [Streptosporangiaceae bacterium]|nr:hypothetical protein [Streptosporangiaceae bacterium]